MALRQRPPSMEARTGSLPWPWRAAAWLATVAAGVALALVLAHWGWRIFGPAAPPLPPLEPPERWTPTIVGAALRARGRAAGAGTGRRRRSRATRGSWACSPSATAPAMRSSACRIAARCWCAPDRTLAKDVRLEAVYRDGVRLRDHGEMRDIALRVPPAASAPATAPDRGRATAPRAACAAPAGYQGPVYRGQRGALDRHRIAAGQLEGAARARAAAVSQCATTADSRRCSACAQAIG